MNVLKMQVAVAKLLTDPKYRESFYNPGAEHKTFGLTVDEFDSLRKINPLHLVIVSEGYAGKRFERINSCYPRTLGALRALGEDPVTNYIANTQFPANDAEERAMFLMYLQKNPNGWKPYIHRFLQDLGTVEARVYDLPRPSGAPAYRIDWKKSRPIRTGYATVIRTSGNLSKAIDSDVAVPEEYPEHVGDWLVSSFGSGLALERISSKNFELLKWCDGERSLKDIKARFGVGVRVILEGWYRRQVIENANKETS